LKDEENKELRLDILIYAHDGRGLGHVSRSLAIGMALRRLYPHLKILFISGSSFTGELLGDAPLDWLKLPSYKTEIVDGKSRGVRGDSMFSDEELAGFRSEELAHVVTLYKPRLVLVDHTPQGKHRELLPALGAASTDCKWFLGVRGVMGVVPQAKEDVTREIFRHSYSGLLWYGDHKILGTLHSRALEKQYGVEPFEVGYVSRLGEYLHCNSSICDKTKARLAGIVSVPWIGEKSYDFLAALAVALKSIGDRFGEWCLFVARGDEVVQDKIEMLFSGLHHCRLRAPSGGYGKELMRAKCAIVYGGYNSLVDVLYANIPSLVILREMQDQEQQDHIAFLEEKLHGVLVGISEEEVTSEQIQGLLLDKLNRSSVDYDVSVNGAECAAMYIHSKL
jgi:predicted glycosyltransferase